MVLSTETNPVVTARCEKLGVPCLQGLGDKGRTLRRWLDDTEITAEDTIYVGNDVNDVECLRQVGCAVAVADAHPAVRQYATLILTERGGYGAVRELTDLIEERMGAPDGS